MLIPSIEALSLLIGLALSAILLGSRRFGLNTWMLCLFLVPACLSSLPPLLVSVIPIGTTDSLLLSFSCLLLSVPGGCLVSGTIGRDGYADAVRRRRWFYSAIFLAAPVLVVLLYALRPETLEADSSAGLLS